MEAAGFTDVRLEIWTYGSGFPKSLNVSKSLDKRVDTEKDGETLTYSPVTEEARLWEGWGTANKPSWEPVVVGKKENPGISSMDHAE